jgi:hypothetical protein
MSVSMLKRSMRPRTTSLTPAGVTPRSSAASACFNPRAVITFRGWTICPARTWRDTASSCEKLRSRKTFSLDPVRSTFTSRLPFRLAPWLISRRSLARTKVVLHAEPNAGHRLPVVRFESTLDASELERRNLPDVVWEGLIGSRLELGAAHPALTDDRQERAGGDLAMIRDGHRDCP